MKIAWILNAAADLIQTRGWVKGALGWGSFGDRKLCIEGAIAEAMGLDPDETYGHCGNTQEVNESPAGMALREFLGESLWRTREGYSPEMLAALGEDAPMPFLYEWNDKHHRTEPEVIEALRSAALIAGARETAVRIVVPA